MKNLGAYMILSEFPIYTKLEVLHLGFLSHRSWGKRRGRKKGEKCSRAGSRKGNVAKSGPLSPRCHPGVTGAKKTSVKDGFRFSHTVWKIIQPDFTQYSRTNHFITG